MLLAMPDSPCMPGTEALQRAQPRLRPALGPWQLLCLGMPRSMSLPPLQAPQRPQPSPRLTPDPRAVWQLHPAGGAPPS